MAKQFASKSKRFVQKGHSAEGKDKGYTPSWLLSPAVWRSCLVILGLSLVLMLWSESIFVAISPQFPSADGAANTAPPSSTLRRAWQILFPGGGVQMDDHHLHSHPASQSSEQPQAASSTASAAAEAASSASASEASRAEAAAAASAAASAEAAGAGGATGVPAANTDAPTGIPAATTDAPGGTTVTVLATGVPEANAVVPEVKPVESGGGEGVGGGLGGGGGEGGDAAATVVSAPVVRRTRVRTKREELASPVLGYFRDLQWEFEQQRAEDHAVLEPPRVACVEKAKAELTTAGKGEDEDAVAEAEAVCLAEVDAMAEELRRTRIDLTRKAVSVSCCAGDANCWGGNGCKVEEWDETDQPRPFIAPPNPVNGASSPPLLLLVMPTYTRPMQAAYVEQVAAILKLIPPPFLWIVIENEYKTEETAELLRRVAGKCSFPSAWYTKTGQPWEGLPYVHLTAGVKHEAAAKSRGVRQRNTVLEFLEMAKLDGIVYFMDDDNAYTPELFEEIRKVQRVGVWPVAILKGHTRAWVDRPLAEVGPDGKPRIFAWDTVPFSFYPNGTVKRTYHLDMAGLAFRTFLLREKARSKSPLRFQSAPGLVEDGLMKQLVKSSDELEPLGDLCTDVNVFHLHAEVKPFIPTKLGVNNSIVPLSNTSEPLTVRYPFSWTLPPAAPHEKFTPMKPFQYWTGFKGPLSAYAEDQLPPGYTPGSRLEVGDVNITWPPGYGLQSEPRARMDESKDGYSSCTAEELQSAGGGGGGGAQPSSKRRRRRSRRMLLSDEPANPRANQKLIVVTTTEERQFQMASMVRLAHILHLLPVPVHWVVVELGAKTNDTALMLEKLSSLCYSYKAEVVRDNVLLSNITAVEGDRKLAIIKGTHKHLKHTPASPQRCSKFSYVHLATPDAARGKWHPTLPYTSYERCTVLSWIQRSKALGYLEKYITRSRKDPVVVFTDDRNLYTPQFFMEALKVESVGMLPAAITPTEGFQLVERPVWPELDIKTVAGDKMMGWETYAFEADAEGKDMWPHHADIHSIVFRPEALFLNEAKPNMTRKPPVTLPRFDPYYKGATVSLWILRVMPLSHELEILGEKDSRVTVWVRDVDGPIAAAYPIYWKLPIIPAAELKPMEKEVFEKQVFIMDGKLHRQMGAPHPSHIPGYRHGRAPEGHPLDPSDYHRCRMFIEPGRDEYIRPGKTEIGKYRLE